MNGSCENKELNRLLLTGPIPRKREALSDEHPGQLQMSSEHLVEMRQLVGWECYISIYLVGDGLMYLAFLSLQWAWSKFQGVGK